MGLKLSAQSSPGSGSLMNTFRLDITIFYVSLDVGFFEQNLLPVPHESYLVLEPADGIQGTHEDGCDLFDGIEFFPCVHSSPKILFNWFLVSKLRDLIFPSTKREAQAGVLFASSAIFTWLKLLSMHQSINFFISFPSSFLFIMNNIITNKLSMSSLLSGIIKIFSIC